MVIKYQFGLLRICLHLSFPATVSVIWKSRFFIIFDMCSTRIFPYLTSFLLFSFVLIDFIYCDELPEIATEYVKEDEDLSSKTVPKFSLVVLPPIFSIFGIVILIISVLTTIICMAYCVFIPWAYSLSSVLNNKSPSTNREQAMYIQSEEVTEQ